MIFLDKQAILSTMNRGSQHLTAADWFIASSIGCSKYPAYLGPEATLSQSKIMFRAQGNGRGDMTRAISDAQTFEREGHEIVALTVGTNPSRTIPEFFARESGDRLRPIASPGVAFQRGRGVATLATLRDVVLDDLL
jgi:hypothetical protein